MKVMGLFSGDILVGRGSNDGSGYLYGYNVPSRGCTCKPFQAKGLKVYEKRDERELDPKGKVMELIQREGGMAIVKDEYDKNHVALLCDTAYVRNPNRLFLQGVLVTQAARQRKSKIFKKRWVIW